MKKTWSYACVILILFVSVTVLSELSFAREGAGTGIFFDLAGSLSGGGVLPSTRLVLGSGFTVAHLDVLFGLPTVAIPSPGLRFLPYFVLNFPFKFSLLAILTPYVGIAPVLFTTSALATPPLADWIFKSGLSFTFGGFGMYAETGFFVPIAALPSFALGFMLDFDSMGSLFCTTCIDESIF